MSTAPTSTTILTAGQDYGKRADFSTLVLLTVDPVMRTAETAGIKVWDHCDYRVVMKDTLTIYLKKRWKMLDLDVMPVGEVMSEDYTRLGMPNEAVKFSAPSKQDMMSKCLSLFSQKRLKLKGKSANDQLLLQQIREQGMEHAQGQDEDKTAYSKYNHPSSSHDDVLWGLCLAVRAARRYLFAATPMIRSSFDWRQRQPEKGADLVFKAMRERWRATAYGGVAGDYPASRLEQENLPRRITRRRHP